MRKKLKHYRQYKAEVPSQEIIKELSRNNYVQITQDKFAEARRRIQQSKTIIFGRMERQACGYAAESHTLYG